MCEVEDGQSTTDFSHDDWSAKVEDRSQSLRRRAVCAVQSMELAARPKRDVITIDPNRREQPGSRRV
jgi:hypothetical protein